MKTATAILGSSGLNYRYFYCVIHNKHFFSLCIDIMVRINIFYLLFTLLLCDPDTKEISSCLQAPPCHAEI
jgi:hypothetical protein